MPTPHPGTIQEPDLENIYQPPKRRWPFDLLLSIQIVEISIGSCIHNVACCALGRFMLDHFHLWNSRWIIPPDAPSIEKHAELIPAFVAGCLAGPATYGGAVAADSFIIALRKRHVQIRIPRGDGGVWAIYLLSLWILMAVIGAILHPRFRYVNVGSILGVFGFGNLFLFFPTLGLVLYMIEKRWLMDHPIS
ncbi:hypothetical protein DL96DRAFT_1643354 [Flagelloscypha sp. PMI_526]|nr:hypothetical protein DL96DRAFT_1643354 [Flagelloscypha sp. PMI_526]